MSYILNNLLKNDMDYDEQGQIVVQEINNGVAKPKFFPNSNDQITVDKLLETETKSFIKLNNGEGHQQGNGQTPITKVTSGTQKSGQTLAQRRAAAALSE
jgi:hypothetical protein